MVDCKKCEHGTTLYRRDRAGPTQSFSPVGLVRCKERYNGRAYVSKDTKPDCGAYTPKRLPRPGTS